MTTLQERIETATGTLETDAGLMHAIVHGTSAQSVVTEGGPVPTVAKRLADLSASYAAVGAVAACTAERVLAQTARTGAETARTGAETARNVATAAAGALDILALSSVLPSLDLRPVPEWAPPMATFSRASAATRVNERGLLESVASGVLRHDYNPVTGEYLGWLLEGAATNFFLYSNDLTQSAWSKTRCSIGGTAIGPDGTASLQKIVEDTTASSSHYVHQTVNYTAGIIYTASAYVKSGERTEVLIAVPATAFIAGVTHRVRFNLVDETVTAISGNISGKLTKVGRDIYRIEATYTPTITISVATLFELGNGTVFVYDGDGASGAYIGFMNVAASGYAASHIYTTTAAVTRGADVFRVWASEFQINLNEGTLFVDVVPDLSDTAQVVAALNGGSSVDQVVLWYRANNRLTAQISSGGATQVELITPTSAGACRAAVSFKQGDFAFAVNGAIIGTATSGHLPTNITRLDLGQRAGGSPLFGHVRRAAVFPRALSAAELQLITGGQS